MIAGERLPGFLVGATGWLGGAVAPAQPGLRAIPAASVLADGGADLRASLLPGDVILNAAGSTSADPEILHAYNVDLVAILVAAAAARGAWLVHVGSAAEYGLDQPVRLRETDPASPASDYGRSKLAGTHEAMAHGNASVLRVFNIAGRPARGQTPLADVVQRVAEGLAHSRDVRVLCAGTVRDWVPKDFVVHSLVRACELRPAGVFNVCTGIGLGMGELAQACLAAVGSPLGVVDEQAFPVSSVVGDPSAWQAISGLSSAPTSAELARIIMGTPVSDVPRAGSADLLRVPESGTGSAR